MDRRDLEIRAVSDLEKDGYLVQRALFSIKHLPDGRIISNQSDIFGVWDIIAVKPDECRLIQICSGSTFQDHMKKINGSFPVVRWAKEEIWYYHKEKNRWKYDIYIRSPVLKDKWIPIEIKSYASA